MKYFLSAVSFLFISFRIQAQVIQAGGTTTFCSGGSVTLTVSPTTGITGYQWINSGTNVGTDASSFTATLAGSYTVKLTRAGLPDTTIGPIVVSVIALPTVSVNSASYCVGQSATLTASGANTYSWSPAASLSAISGSVVIANPSSTTTYVVTGKNTNSGCSNTAVATITVNPLPAVPTFSFTPTGQCANLPVTFNITSPITGYTYTWDFGDASSASSGFSVSHLFNAAIGNGNSTFNVRVKATAPTNCSVTSSVQVVTIKQKPSAVLADFTNQPPFTNCVSTTNNTNFTLVVDNDTKTSNTNTLYKIDWGDGSTPFTASSFANTNHTYTTLGYFTIKYSVNGINGCQADTSYTVYNGSNPGIGLSSNGSTILQCLPATDTFFISNTTNNPPGTTYTVSFNDGSPNLVYQHPPPSSFVHTFTKSSCGATGGLIPNTFVVRIEAKNPCGSLNGAVEPVTTITRPEANFTISPDVNACANTTVNFTNTSLAGSVVQNNGTCDVGNISNWVISPSTGWTIVSGGIGDTNPNNNPSTWGSQILGVKFSIAGNYSIKLVARNNSVVGTSCRIDSIVRSICVTSRPVSSFTLNSNVGCAPLNIKASNTSISLNNCKLATYLWSVSYLPAFCGISSSWDFTNGTTDTSANPSFVFKNSGKYTITLKVTNACGTFQNSEILDVKRPPSVSITPPTYPCGPVNVNPAAKDTSCGTSALTYLWTFDGGSPATSTTANPGSISFSSVGLHAITLAVTNECGTTTANSSVTVSAAPDVIVPANQIYCGGQAAGPFNFSSAIGTPVYNWTNSNPAIGLPASGSGTIPSFTAINNGTTPITATITVTPFVSLLCSGVPATFTLTINPKPLAPPVVSPVTYCLNATAVPLTANAATSNTLTWFNNAGLTGGTNIAPTPSTTTNAIYYVTQANGFNCASTAAVISVIVNPNITGNTIASDQNICANTIPAVLNTVNTVGGGSGNFTYQWQRSTDGGTIWANIGPAKSASYLPPALSATTKYRRVINSSTCADTSNIVTITVQGALDNYNIAASQTICEGSAPDLLTGELPTGGGGSYSYLWESSIDNISWISTGNTGQDYQPVILFQTTYFRRQTLASQCNAVSPIVTINVNPAPIGLIKATIDSICEYDAAGVAFTATKGTAPFAIELTITKPNGSDTTILQNSNTNGPTIINVISPNSAAGNYIIKLKKITDAKGCPGISAAVSTDTINVKPRPVLSLSTPPTICNGTTTLLTASGATEYLWTPNIGLSNTTGDSITANPASTTSYTVTGKLNNCLASGAITVTVTPGTTTANAGPDQILCNVANATLAANNPVTGLGSWSQKSGPPVSFADASLPNTTITGLIGGERYVFEWTITGLSPCPPTVSSITIDVLIPVINTIKKDTVICNGQSVLLQTENLSGGNTKSLVAQYTYQWEMASPGQSNWQAIIGETQEALTTTPAASTCYRRKVKSNNFCEEISNTVCITVNPTIGNNTIGASQKICVNTIPSNLTGTAPTGGDNNYIYQWQTSTDSINWINALTSLNYQPAAYSLAGVHYFRRDVTSGNCTSISNVITITVNPDSKAIFTTNSSTSCAPFNLSTAINISDFPDRNGLYQWYADGVLFGSNNTGIFPGYTIINPADTVIVQLKTTSQYGCKPDSMEQQFVTVITAIAKFSKDTSAGCGPLPVTFTNISSILNSGIQYFWDFGNGVKSSLLQPATIIFNSSPFFNDTTYQVSLKAYNGCDTTVWRDSVKVRSNPKARFGLDTTFGCSPFTVQINNTSPGGPNKYYWDFGDGKKDTTFTNGLLNHTYNTGSLIDTLTIRLIAENECARDTQSINIRIAPNIIKPLINVNSSQLFGCAPHIVLFSNNSSGATKFTWNFGDNSAVEVTNNNQSAVIHQYSNPGIFTVRVDITNGCSDTTVYREITVYAKPIAAFKTNTPIYCEGDTIRVNNTSLNATNYRWFWGDGTTSGGLNPVHVYSVAGNYNILLRAERSNASGTVCLDTLAIPVIVLAKPVVSVQSNIKVINCAPFTLHVTATGIINESVTWYFYDSTVNPTITTSNAIASQHVFKKPGSFYAKLVAVNAQGCTDSTIILFTVRGKAVASFTPFDLSICTRDTTINYINTSTYNGTDPISYRWLVDNALIATTANFIHRYNVLPNAILPKNYTTSLIVSNTVGCNDTALATLNMNPLAKAQFSIGNPNNCVPFRPIISNASSYTTTYRWLLNGLLVDTAANPVIVITQGATPYTISLIADNIYGCKPDTFRVSFISRARPKAAFRLSDTLGCTGVLNVATTNLTTGASTYTWSWGDGTPNSLFSNPTHLYTTPGQYSINLIASDGTCTDTISQVVRVSLKPVVDFSVDQTVTCDTARVQFTNLSSNAANYTWSFGDGSFSNVTNPAKSYAPNAVPYTVKLIATSTFGCKDSAVKANLVLARPKPDGDFFISPTPVITVPNYTFSFNNLTLNSARYKYLWSLGDGSFASTRDVTHKYTDTGNYPIQLIVLDTVTNCPDTTIKIARIDGFPGYLYVPNAICPSCIQSNLREFIPKGVGLKEYRLQIYTTWNELIFETRTLDSKGSPTQAWDGKFKGTIVQQDVYVWRIDAKFLNGSEWIGMIYPGEAKYKKAGTITVVK